MQYLIELEFPVPAAVPTPAEVLAFTERYVFPTLETCSRWTAEGRILAGGPVLGSRSLAFVLSCETGEDLDAWLPSLPLWTRGQTRIVPLGSFENRRDRVRQRLIAAASESPAATSARQQ